MTWEPCQSKLCAFVIVHLSFGKKSIQFDVMVEVFFSKKGVYVDCVVWYIQHKTAIYRMRIKESYDFFILEDGLYFLNLHDLIASYSTTLLDCRGRKPAQERAANLMHKGPSWISNPESSCCKERVINLDLLCLPKVLKWQTKDFIFCWEYDFNMSFIL